MNAQDRIIWARTDKGVRIGTARDIILALKNGLNRRVWMQRQALAMGFDYRGVLAEGASVKAEVNHGRWIARCECGGAEDVDPADPVFYCLSCGNALVNGELLFVEFPKDLGFVEAELLKREMENRNWLPGETIVDLRAENEAHGV